MCGWTGTNMVCGGGHTIIGSNITNGYEQIVPAVSLYCKSSGHVNDVFNLSTNNEGMNVETRALTANKLYDKEKHKNNT